MYDLSSVSPSLAVLPIHLIVKIVLVAFLVFYFLFALLMTRQIQIMTKVLQTLEQKDIQNYGWIHLGLSLLVLLVILILF